MTWNRALLLGILTAVMAIAMHVAEGSVSYKAGWSTIFEDDFTADPTANGWFHDNSVIGHDSPNGNMTLVATSSAHYDLAGEGKTAPASLNLWGAATVGTTGSVVGPIGPGLRVQADGNVATGSRWYLLGQLGTDLMVYACEGGPGGFPTSTEHTDGRCEEFHGEASVQEATVGDVIAYAVVGLGSSTEFALWSWDSASLPDDPCNPSTWGPAHFCVSAAADDVDMSEPQLNKSTVCDCGIADTCNVWDSDPGNALSGTGDYPDTESGYAITGFSAFVNLEISGICGGEVL